MLYNPEWEPKRERDPFSLESLIAWLELQPGTKAYNYVDCRNCLLGQYFKAMGFENVDIGSRVMSHRDFDKLGRTYENLPRHFNAIAVGLSPWDVETHTFGWALARAKTIYGAQFQYAVSIAA